MKHIKAKNMTQCYFNEQERKIVNNLIKQEEKELGFPQYPYDINKRQNQTRVFNYETQRYLEY